MSQEEPTIYICVGCRARSPEVETEYTLISSRFGWRLTRRFDKDGRFAMEWRCPTCWQRYKSEKQLATTPSEGLPAYSEERSERPTPPPPSSRPLVPPSSTPPKTPKR
jgi:hypothetical protein